MSQIDAIDKLKSFVGRAGTRALLELRQGYQADSRPSVSGLLAIEIRFDEACLELRGELESEPGV